MKMNKISSTKLKQELGKHVKDSGLSYAEIARISKVHSSQVSRICRGEFCTMSHNVVQVCTVLGVDLGSIRVESAKLDPFGALIADTALEVWDKTPEDAERLIRFLRDLAHLRSPA